jgi:hypothetical protein
LFYYPISRLALRGEGAFGLYKGTLTENATDSWWLRAGAELGFRVSPSFTVSLNGGYRYFNNPAGGRQSSPETGRTVSPAPLYSGIYLGLGVQVTPVEITVPGQGFTEAWRIGAREWRQFAP